MASKRASRSSNAERYRTAAEQVLDQLEFAIEYLHRIQKHELAASLSRNRKAISKRLR